MDGRCCTYFRVEYTDVVKRTLAGGSDEAIFDWSLENGRALEGIDLFIWNEYAYKMGWNDARSEVLKTYKSDSGLSDRDEIQTMFQSMEVDEGRDEIQIA